jgi:hypothetical protein
MGFSKVCRLFTLALAFIAAFAVTLPPEEAEAFPVVRFLRNRQPLRRAGRLLTAPVRVFRNCRGGDCSMVAPAAQGGVLAEASEPASELLLTANDSELPNSSPDVGNPPDLTIGHIAAAYPRPLLASEPLAPIYH